MKSAERFARICQVLSSLDAVTRMSSVMAHDGDANSCGEFAVEKVVRESLQISPAKVFRIGVKVFRVFSGLFGVCKELCKEVVSERARDEIIPPKDFADIPLNGGVKLKIHCRRSR